MPTNDKQINHDNAIQFGDPCPPAPARTRQPLSESLHGRIFYGSRAKWLRLTHLRRPKPIVPKPDQVERLLVVQDERLGDLILTEPALRALRFHFPEAERTFICPPFGQELYAGSGWGNIQGMDYLEEMVGKRQPDYDLVIDFTGRVEIQIAKMLAGTGIPARVGFDRGGREVYLTNPVAFPEITIPMREAYLSLTRSIDAKTIDPIPALPCGKDRLERGWRAWTETGLVKPVVMMPGAHYPEQRWAPENFVKVGQTLKREGVELAVITGPGEEHLGSVIAKTLKIPHVSALSITELMDRLATAQAAICNNTGTLHMAAALGIPTVSTMGPTIPWRWWPAGSKPAIVFRGGSNERVGYLDRIDPVEASAAILHLLDL